MSLIRQLWIAVIVMMSIAFISSFSISTYKAKDYFEEQLLLKNIDNASSLALTLSQIDKDPVTLELLIAAQFDTGHYQRIALIDPEGSVLQQRVFEGDAALGIPEWFQQFASLQIEPGVAQVQDGWFQYGTLFVESHTRFAYQALWTTTRDLFIWFLVVSMVAGGLGTLILKFITRPLDDVVNQAEAIGGRRFITSQEPSTLEFGRVVRAMNILSGRIRSMLDTERQRLEEMRYKNQHDAVTGLANRDYFFNQLDTHLHSIDKDSQHALVLVRVRHLANLNQQLGHKEVDELLVKMAQSLQATLKHLTGKYTQTEIGRLNGSDFGLILSDVTDLAPITDAILSSMIALSDAYCQRLELPAAAMYFSPTAHRAEVMMKLDTLLAQAEQKEKTCIEIALLSQTEMRFHSSDEWRVAILEALSKEQVTAERYPVISANGQLLHYESMMRLELLGQVHTAGYFIPWARRLGMLPELDLSMVSHELKQMERATRPTAINLSVETLMDVVAVNRLVLQLKQAPHIAAHLWFEVTERCAVQHADVFKEFCKQVKPFGCHIGLEKAGAEFARIKHLEALGLDYIKLDYAFIADLDNNTANQNFIRGLATLAHSIGLMIIADGVRKYDSVSVLSDLGIDAFSGPAIKET